MNILIDPLPETVLIGGREWAVNSAFFIGVQFELLMQDPELTGEEKLERALGLYYPERPADLEGALERILWFYRCGTELDASAKPASTSRAPKAYCFEQDAGLIYAAFRQYYGMDLNAVEDLHWWKFRALFRGLPAGCELCKVMDYRTADLKGMTKSQKEFYKKMRARFALKSRTDVASALSLAERDRCMRDYVARRFEEMEHRPEAG